MKRKDHELSLTAEASKRARIRRKENEFLEQKRNRELAGHNRSLMRRINDLENTFEHLRGNKYGVNNSPSRDAMRLENENLKDELSKYRFLASKMKEILNIYNKIDSTSRLSSALDKNIDFIVSRISELALNSARSRAVDFPISENKRIEQILHWIFSVLQGNYVMPTFQDVREGILNLLANEDPFSTSHLKKEIRYNKDEGWFRADVFEIPADPESLAKSWRQSNNPSNFLAPVHRLLRMKSMANALRKVTFGFDSFVQTRVTARRVRHDSKDNLDILKFEATPNEEFSAEGEEREDLKEEEMDPSTTFCIMFERKTKMNEANFPETSHFSGFDEVYMQFLCYVNSPIITLEDQQNASLVRTAIFRNGSLPGTCNLTYMVRRKKVEETDPFKRRKFSFIDFFSGPFTEVVLKRRFEFWLRTTLKHCMGKRETVI